MERFKEKYERRAGEINAPEETINRLNNLVLWLSQEENERMRVNLKISINALLKRLSELMQERQGRKEK